MTSALSRDRWEQIRAAFEEIVELDSVHRGRRLMTIGAKDPELRSTLESLLEADARANAWLAPVESPLGFVPSESEELTALPNAADVSIAPVSRKRRRWLLLAGSLVALGAGGIAVVRQFSQPAAADEADWSASAPEPVIAAPQPVNGARSFSLVAVNLRGEERPIIDIPSRNAGSRRPNVLDTGYFAWPKISPDGKRIAVEVPTGDRTWDIWVYDLASRSQTRLTHDFTGIKPFGWTPDSRNLVYLAVDDGDIGWTHRVVSRPWDGRAPPRQLLQTSFPIMNVAMGPSNGSVVIRPTGDHNLQIASLRSSGTASPLVTIRASTVDLDLSRDGLLAYVNDESGTNEIYVLPLSDPSRRVQVSQGGGTQPVWSPDGRHLFYRTSDRMMRARVRNAERPTVERVEPLFADIYERHDITNYDVFPSGEELVMIRSRGRDR